MFGGKFDVVDGCSAINKCCSLHPVCLQLTDWLCTLPDCSASHNTYIQILKSVTHNELSPTFTSFKTAYWVLVQVFTSYFILCNFEWVRRYKICSYWPCSSQIQAVRSKEHVANTWPNSGWAHVTLHTDPECVCRLNILRNHVTTFCIVQPTFQEAVHCHCPSSPRSHT